MTATRPRTQAFYSCRIVGRDGGGMQTKHAVTEAASGDDDVYDIVVHIPHSSRVIPGDLRTDILLADYPLDIELRQMTDAYTDELFGGGLPAREIVFPVS